MFHIAFERVPEATPFKTQIKTNKNTTPETKTQIPFSEETISLSNFNRSFVQHWRNWGGHSCPSSYRTIWRRPFVHTGWDYILLARRRTGSGFGPSGSGWVRAGGGGGFQLFSVRCRRCSVWVPVADLIYPAWDSEDCTKSDDLHLSSSLHGCRDSQSVPHVSAMFSTSFSLCYILDCGITDMLS